MGRSKQSMGERGMQQERAGKRDTAATGKFHKERTLSQRGGTKTGVGMFLEDQQEC